MKVLLKSEAEQSGLLLNSNCVRGFIPGDSVIIDMINKLKSYDIDVSIFRGISQSKIVEINLYMGWYKVEGSGTVIPINQLCSAEKTYLLTYLCEITKTDVVGLGILDEFSYSTAKDYFRRFGNCAYMTIVCVDDIVCMRCNGLLEEVNGS